MSPPAVQDAPPPKSILRAVNPLMKAVLRSPLHRLLSGKLMLLTMTGRKSGRTYTLPVWRHQSADGDLLISAGGNWRHNLRGGTDVRVRLAGRDHAGRAVLEVDSAQTVELFKEMLERSGARALAVKVNVSGSPTAEEIAPAMRERGVAYLKLLD
jgi:hypothetical protein